MARLAWSAPAIGDLARLRSFLKAKNPRAASKAISTIRESVLHLEQFPLAGRTTSPESPQWREWLVRFGKSGYVVRYRVDGDQVTILRVRHMREAGYSSDPQA